MNALWTLFNMYLFMRHRHQDTRTDIELRSSIFHSWMSSTNKKILSCHLFISSLSFILRKLWWLVFPNMYYYSYRLMSHEYCIFFLWHMNSCGRNHIRSSNDSWNPFIFQLAIEMTQIYDVFDRRHWSHQLLENSENWYPQCF